MGDQPWQVVSSNVSWSELEVIRMGGDFDRACAVIGPPTRSELTSGVTLEVVQEGTELLVGVSASARIGASGFAWCAARIDPPLLLGISAASTQYVSGQSPPGEPGQQPHPIYTYSPLYAWFAQNNDPRAAVLLEQASRAVSADWIAISEGLAQVAGSVIVSDSCVYVYCQRSGEGTPHVDVAVRLARALGEARRTLQHNAFEVGVANLLGAVSASHGLNLDAERLKVSGRYAEFDVVVAVTTLMQRPITVVRIFFAKPLDFTVAAYNVAFGEYWFSQHTDPLPDVMLDNASFQAKFTLRGRTDSDAERCLYRDFGAALVALHARVPTLQSMLAYHCSLELVLDGVPDAATVGFVIEQGVRMAVTMAPQSVSNLRRRE